MALDFQIITFTDVGRIQCASWPNPAFVDGDYGLVQTLFKCLLTNPGEDAFDPDWGAGLIAGLYSISGADTSAANEIVSAGLLKATSDLQAIYPILRISATRLEYVVGLTSWQLDLSIETTSGTLQVSLPSF